MRTALLCGLLLVCGCESKQAQDDRIRAAELEFKAKLAQQQNELNEKLLKAQIKCEELGGKNCDTKHSKPRSKR